MNKKVENQKKEVKVQRGLKVSVKCSNPDCENVRHDIRAIDVRRGRGLYCSKSCASICREIEKKRKKEEECLQ